MANLEFTQPIKCYNGAYDSASQRVIDAQAAALAKIRKQEPDAWTTYHPVEGRNRLTAPSLSQHRKKGKPTMQHYNRQFSDTPRGRIRRDTRKAARAAKRAWIAAEGR